MIDKAFSIKLHLAISAAVVIPVGLIYGFDPGHILPGVLWPEVGDLELKNMIRSVMGLYLTLGFFWIFAIKNPAYWNAATLINVLFMGGLAFGRLISMLFDGISLVFTVGMLLETFMMAWGIFNLKSAEELENK
jgi:hypothetical protein